MEKKKILVIRFERYRTPSMFCLINENCIALAFTIHFAQLTLHMVCVYLSCLLLSITLGVVISKTNEAKVSQKCISVEKVFVLEIHSTTVSKENTCRTINTCLSSSVGYIIIDLYLNTCMFITLLIGTWKVSVCLLPQTVTTDQLYIIGWIATSHLKTQQNLKMRLWVCVHSPERVGHD